MLKRLLVLVCLLIPVVANGQGNAYQPQLLTFNGQPFGVCDVYQVAANVQTGDYFSCNPKTRQWIKLGLGVTTVANLPSAAASTNQMFLVTDGTNTGDCTTGGSTTRALCISDGAAWHPVGSGGSGGGGAPTAPTNSLQKTITPGSTFGPSSITDNGTTVNIAEPVADTIFAGPNPRFDIRNFGAVFGLIHTTGSINASSTTLTTAVAFAAGMGVTVRGAGPNVAVSTPAAPTVSPATAGALVGTKVVTSFAGGGTTYQYQVVAEDIGGGLSAASTATVIATGPASLGKQTATVSSWTRSNNVVTINTTGAETIQAGTLVQIFSNDEWTNGTYRVTAVNSNTQFTVTTGLDTRSVGVPASGGGGGSITWFQCNHITIAHQANAFRYYIYGRTAGSMTRIGETVPDNATVSSDLQYNTFDDFGSGMTIAPPAPDFVPSSPPGAAKNQDLTTTVVSVAGGGTTLTLAAAATNTVSGAVTRMDAAPAIIAAAAAAYAGSPRAGIVLIPSSASGNFETNSILNFNVFPNIVTIEQSGGLQLGDTITGNATIIWKGQSNPQSCPSFTFECYPAITSNTADPLIYAKTQAITLSHLSINGQANDILVVSDGNAIIPNNQFDHVAFSTPTSDFTSVHLLYRGGNSSSSSFYNWVSFTPGEGNTTNAPVAIGSFNGLGPGPTTMVDIFTTKRGFYSACGWTGTVDWIYGQGLVAPYFTLDDQGCGSLNSYLDIRDTIFDTTFAQSVAYLSSNEHGIIRLTGTQGVVSNPLVVGPGSMSVDLQGFPLTSGATQFSQSGQNVGSKYGPVSTSLVDGSIATAANGATSFKQTDNFNHSIGHPYNLFVESAQMAPPTCSVIAGGSLAIQAWTVFVAPVYANNAEGMASRGTSCGSTSSGNQTLQIGWSVAPGAIGYEVFANSGTGLIGTFPMVSGGGSTSVNVTSDFHGFTGQNAAGSGSSYMASDIVSAPSFQISPNGGGITSLTAAPWIWTGPLGSCGTPPSVTSTSGSSLCLGDAAGAVNGSFNGDAWKKLLRTGDVPTGSQVTPNMQYYYLAKISAGGCPPGMTNCTAVNADGNIISDGTSNSTTVVTCPNNDCNFSQADVGKTFWGTTQGGGGAIFGNGNVTTFVCPTTTIASVQSATQATLNLACTASGTANVMFTWGHRDGAILHGLDGNNGPCANIIPPNFSTMLIDQAEFIVGPTVCPTGNTNPSGAQPLREFGDWPPSSTIVFTPDFNYATCTGNGGSFLGNTVCFGSGLSQLNNTGFGGSGLTPASNSNCANASGKTIIAMASGGGSMQGVNVNGICPGETGIGVALNGFDEYWIGGGAQYVMTKPCEVNQQATVGIILDCLGNGVAAIVNGMTVENNGSYTDIDSYPVVGLSIANGSTVNTRGTHIYGNAAGPSCGVAVNGKWLSYGDFIGVDSPGTNTAAEICGGGGNGNAQLVNTVVKANNSGGGQAAISLGTSPFTLISGGGNTITGAVTGFTPGANLSGWDILQGVGTGVATSASTLGLYGLGNNQTTTLTSTVTNLGPVMGKSGTVFAMQCTATAGNQAADACTVLKNNVAQSMTCSLNGVTWCLDGAVAHQFSYSPGDIITVKVVSGTGTTLANVKASVIAW